MTAPVQESTSITRLSPLKTQRSTLVELIASMRFAIALLVIICIASIIGTVIQQLQPSSNYINQFGPFWAPLFGWLGLYTVYSSIWFLVILGFLVLSTSLCIARNTPKILRDLGNYKEHIREQNLASFPHQFTCTLTSDPLSHGLVSQAWLTQQGWKVKLEKRPHGLMLAAKKGALNKLGYLATHSAIVLICLGGLLDSDILMRLQIWVQGLHPIENPALENQDPRHILSPKNPAFRGNLPVVEGTSSNTAVINTAQGLLLQPLPFQLELKRFHVEYYSTGMPKLFASDVVIHDPATGHTIPTTIKVNHPFTYQGVSIFQSSFQDGGSKLTLRVHSLQTHGKPHTLIGRVGEAQVLAPTLTGTQPLLLELTDLRVINVENLGTSSNEAQVDPRKVDFINRLEHQLGSGNPTETAKQLQNIGPSVSFKLRDNTGQAHEFQNYMRPINLNGQRVFLSGVRDTPGGAMRFLRIPADAQDTPDDWLRLKMALADASLRQQAVQRYVALALPDNRPDLAPALTNSAQQALALFAGLLPAASQSMPPATPPLAGLPGLSRFIESSVPDPEREQAADVLIRIVNGTLFELLNASRAQEQLPPLAADENTRQFMTQAVLSLSDSFFYPAPVWIELDQFEHIQASVFQVSKAPGQYIVYLGCLLLTCGVFAMLYIRDRRLWIWLAADDQQRTQLKMAFSCNRQTIDTEREFQQLQTVVPQLAQIGNTV